MSGERQEDIRAAGFKSRNAMAWLRDHHLPAEPVCYTIAYEYLFTENQELKTYVDKVDLTQNNYREVLEKAYHQLIVSKKYKDLSMKADSTSQYAAEILSLLVGKLENNEDHSEALDKAKEVLNETIVEVDDIDSYSMDVESGPDSYIRVKNGESRDELTQVLDKNGLKSTLKEAIAYPENYPMAVIHIDIDLFSQFNKVNGKTMGNAAIKNLAKILSDSFRGSDIVSRGDDDNFILVLPKTSAVRASELSDAIRKKIAAISLKKKNSQVVAKMTISVGVSELTSSSQLNDSFVKALKALNRSINLGRNCVNREV